MVQSLFAHWRLAPLSLDAFVLLSAASALGAVGKNLRNATDEAVDVAKSAARRNDFREHFSRTESAYPTFKGESLWDAHPEDYEDAARNGSLSGRRAAESRGKMILPAVSLCGASKRSLEEDGVRRNCLRQCRLDDGHIRPTFSEWEKFCRDTAGIEEWDSSCEQYFCCTFGCDIYGGDRNICTKVAIENRRNLLVETQADLLQGITQEQRCEMQKCHAYCARNSFDTCRETMFREACEGSNPHLYSCDVACNGAASLRPLAALLLAALAAAAGWSGVSM